MVEIVAERGFEGVTVRRLCRVAGVSTGTFYRHYANREACFEATYERVMSRAGAIVSSSLRDGNGDWADGLRDGLCRLMDEIARRPEPAFLALIGAFAVGPGMIRRMERAFKPFEEDLASMHQRGSGRALPGIIKGIVAGVARVTRAQLLSGATDELPGTVEPLIDWILPLLDVSPDELRPLIKHQPASGSQDTGRTGGSFIERFDQPIDDRSRILAATARLGTRHGYWGLTARNIRAQAGVSRRVFDAHFSDVGQCFLATVEALASSACQEVARAGLRTDCWDQKVCRTAGSICTWIARDPMLIQFGFTDIFAPGTSGLEVRARILSHTALALRQTMPVEHRLSGLASEASVAASWRVIQSEIAKGPPRQLAHLAPTAAYLALAPAIGRTEALRSIHVATSR